MAALERGGGNQEKILKLNRWQLSSPQSGSGSQCVLRINWGSVHAPKALVMWVCPSSGEDSRTSLLLKEAQGRKCAQKRIY